MDAKRAENYIRRSQLAIGLVLVALIALFMLSGLGTLSTSNVVASVQNLSRDSVSIGVDYSAFNPGPVALQPVSISIVVTTPEGVPLSTEASQLVDVHPFGSSSGHLSFNLTLLPGAANTILSLNKQGLSPLVTVNVKTSFWGLVYSSLTYTSNMTVA
jgi:hypothetical protein